MLCRVEMPANEQIYGRFYRYKVLRGGAGGQGGRSGLLLMSFVVLVFCGVLLFSGGGMALPMGLLLVLLAYLLYTLYLRPLSLFRATPSACMHTEVTIFTENGLNRNVTSEEGGPPDTTSMQYTALHKAVETKRDFYLFTAPGQAFLVEKAYFTKGSPEELHEILKNALGEKFNAKR